MHTRCVRPTAGCGQVADYAEGRTVDTGRQLQETGNARAGPKHGISGRISDFGVILRIIP
jgi:hypothetical protein